MVGEFTSDQARRVVDALPWPVLLVSQDGSVVAGNRAAALAFGPSDHGPAIFPPPGWELVDRAGAPLALSDGITGDLRLRVVGVAAGDDFRQWEIGLSRLGAGATSLLVSLRGPLGASGLLVSGGAHAIVRLRPDPEIEHLTPDEVLPGRCLGANLAADAVTLLAGAASLDDLADVPGPLAAPVVMSLAPPGAPERIVELEGFVRPRPDGSVVLDASVRDITERIRAERERDAAADRFRLLAEHAGDVVFELGDDGRVRWASPSTRTLFGFEPERTVGLDPAEFVPPAHREDLWAHWDALLAGSEGEALVLPARTADGTYRWMRATARPLPTSPGEARRFAVGIHDVHEEYVAHEAAARSEEYYRAMLLHSCDVVLVMDADGRRFHGVEEWERRFGLEPGPDPARQFYEMIHPQDRTRLVDAFRTVVAGGLDHTVTVEHRVRPRGARPHRQDGEDGGWLHVESVLVNRLDDPVVQGVIIAARDVTTRHRLVRALAEAERRFGDVAGALRSGVVVFGDGGRVAYVNDAFAALVHRPVEELIGAPWADLFPSERASRVVAVWKQALKRGGLRVAEVELVRRDGTTVPVVATAAPSRGGDGTLWAVATFTDVADLKRTQAELAEALAAATEAVEAKSRLLSDVSHELRTPLTPLIGFAKLIAEAPDGAKAATYAEQIVRSGERLVRIVDDLLDLSLVSTGAVAIELTPVPVSAVCEEVALLMAPTAQAAGLGVSVEGCDGLALADRDRLVQVLSNLVANGLRHGRTDVVLRVEPDRDVLRCTVVDHGTGIAEADRRRVFEPFVRLTGRSGDGHGLGLAIVRALVEAMGGTVRIEDPPGGGTAMVVELPVAADA